MRSGALIIAVMLASCEQGGDTPTTRTAAPADSSATTAEVIDGPSEVKGPDGTVRMKGNMRHGKRHGIWTSYHAGGAVQSTSGYVDGVLMGPSVVYHPNGEIYYTGDYRDDKQVGEWRFYDGSGSLVKTVHYDSAGTVINDR